MTYKQYKHRVSSGVHATSNCTHSRSYYKCYWRRLQRWWWWWRWRHRIIQPVSRAVIATNARHYRQIRTGLNRTHHAQLKHARFTISLTLDHKCGVTCPYLLHSFALPLCRWEIPSIPLEIPLAQRLTFCQEQEQNSVNVASSTPAQPPGTLFHQTFMTLLIRVYSGNDSRMYFLIVLTTDYCWRSWTSRI